MAIDNIRILEPLCTSDPLATPIQESLDTNLGIWSQNTNDNIDWTIKSGGTSSPGTGPSGANEGSHYLYIESSGNGSGYPNKTATITSSCIEPSSGDALTFDYHMYGSNMGSLYVEVKTETVGWTKLWSKAGNQGNSWETTTVDLSNYVDEVIKLRFRGVTETSYRSDMAIDNINISSGVTLVSKSSEEIPTKKINVELDRDELKVDLVDNVTIFPNPFTNEFTVNLPEILDKEKVNVVLYDVVGKVVYKEELIISSQKFKIKPSISNGTYFLKLSYKHHTITKKLINN